MKITLPLLPVFLAGVFAFTDLHSHTCVRDAECRRQKLGAQNEICKLRILPVLLKFCGELDPWQCVDDADCRHVGGECVGYTEGNPGVCEVLVNPAR
ncbi:unnamed protein product, partial [Mesorhabditis spiculigera]